MSLFSGMQTDNYIIGCSSDHDKGLPSHISMEKYHQTKVVESLNKLSNRDIHSAGSIGQRNSPLQAPKRIMEGALGLQSMYCSNHKSSPTLASKPSTSCGARSPRAIFPTFKLQSPELNSSIRLLAKVQDLHKESFDKAKVIQVNKEMYFVGFNYKTEQCFY